MARNPVVFARVSGGAIASGRVNVSALLAVIMVAALFGCGARRPRGGTVRRRASLETGCPEEQMTATPTGAGGWLVTGCGLSRAYTCTNGWTPICVPSGPTDARVAVTEETPGAVAFVVVEPASASPAQTWSAATVDDLVAQSRTEILACLPASTAALTLDVRLNVDGTVVVLASDIWVDEDSRECVASVLARAWLRGSVAEASTAQLRFARTQSSAPTVPAADPAIEDRVRAHLDARRAAALACVDGATVALAVSWAADGTLEISARGRFAGTAEEACVRAALTHARVRPAPRAAGTIVHALAP